MAQLGRADISIVRGSVAQNAPPVYTDGWISLWLALGDVELKSEDQPLVNGGQGRIFIDNDVEIGWNTASTLTIHALNYFKPTGNSPSNPNATQWLLNPTDGGNVILRSDGTQPVNVLIVDDQVGVDLTGGRIISTHGDVGVYGIAGFTFGTNYGVKMLDTEIRLDEGEFYVQGDAQQANTASYGIHVSGSGVDIVVQDGQITLLGNVFNNTRPSFGVLIQGDLGIQGHGDTDIYMVAQVAGGSGSKGLVVTDQASITTELGDIQISSMLSNNADNLTGIQFSNQSNLSGHLLTMTSEIGHAGSNHTAILLDNSIYSFLSNVYMHGLSQAQGDFLRGIVLRNNSEITTLRRIDLLGNTNVGGEHSIGVLIHNSPQALSSVFDDINIHGISPSMGEHSVGVWIAQNLQQATFPLSLQGSAPSISGDAVIKTLNGPISITGSVGTVPDSKYGVLITDGSLIHAVKNNVTINGTTVTLTPSPPGTASLLVHGSTILTGDPQDPQVSGDIELSAGESQSYDKFVLANARIETLSTGDVRLSSSDDMILNDDTTVRSNSGNVTIVVDSRFLTSQNPGSGGFTTSTASTIEAPGEIRIYTHKRPNNQVLGKIAGLDFIPGIEFLDSPSEQWNTAFPNGTYGGHPFKIYYHEAGQAQIVSVSGHKFDDLNGNGVKDLIEPFLAGFTFYADLNANEQFDQGEPSGVSDANGFFQITNIPAGTFMIREAPIFSWVQTTPTGAQGSDGFSVEVTLSSGQSKNDLLFGNRNLFAPPTSGSISGAVWNDLNKNGQQDQGEPVLQGWVAYIDANDNGQFDQGEPFSVTNANGAYLFDNMPFQGYVIRVNVQQGWEQTSPPQQAGFKHVLLLNANAPNASGLNFGVSQLQQANPFVTVSGIVFHDVNSNGNRDIAEPGIQNVRIYVDSNLNDSYDSGELSDLTDANGFFQIDQIPEGTFRVRADLDAGWTQTFPVGLSGGDGLAFELTLTGGEQNNDLLFGKIEAPVPPGLGSISGHVYYNYSLDEYWHDWSPLHKGLDGKKVSLSGTNDIGQTEHWSTTTDSNGYYTFEDLKAGDYWVQVDEPNYTAVYPESFKPSQLGVTNGAFYRVLLRPGEHIGNEMAGYNFVQKATNTSWLRSATARIDTLVAGLAMWLDVDNDGTPDERVHLSGSMVISQQNPTISGSDDVVEFEIIELNMSGWSDHLGDLRATLKNQTKTTGELRLPMGSINAHVKLDLNLTVLSLSNSFSASNAIHVVGHTLRAPALNSPLIANTSSQPVQYRTAAGSLAFQIHHVQFIAQYGFDLGIYKADFGDAPQSYGTLLRPDPFKWKLDGDILRRSNDGARHIQPNHSAPPLYLGSGLDTEPDGRPSIDADNDSDDGLSPVLLTRGQQVTIPISVTGNGYLTIWIDYNSVGAFNDISGVVVRDAQVSSGTFSFEFTPPYTITDDKLFMRVRLSADPGTSSIGLAFRGEVEDYVFDVAPLASEWTVTGVVYDDKNGNSNWEDADEEGIEGIRVFWDENGNRAYDVGEAYSITDAGGNYELMSDKSGNYEIIPEVGSNWSLPSGFVYPRISLSPGVTSGAMFPLRRLNTSLDFGSDLPSKFELLPAWPNPFNPTTTVKFALMQTNHTSISVYDILGRQVRFFDLGQKLSGIHQFSVDANGLPTGVYIIQLKSGSQTAFQKVSLIK
jgi:hypothetical protein